MPKTVDDLSNERKLVIICSRGKLSDEHVNEIKTLLDSKLDWKEILYQCISHRVLNLLYHHFRALDLLESIDKEILKVMTNESNVYAMKNKLFFMEIKRISEKFKENSIPIAILKGNYLAANVYPSIETRTFNDIDILINKKDSDRVSKVIEGLGYIQGYYDEKEGKIIEFSRKGKLYHQMATHELAEYLKKADNQFVECICVDFNFEVLWVGNCPYKIDTGELLGRAKEVEIDGTVTSILDNEDFLIQLACHLYKEAALVNWITELRDLKLYKFADILMFVEKHYNDIRWDKLIKFCKDNKCEKVVYFAFHYVNLIYGNVIPIKVMDTLEPEDLSFLDEYGVENEKPSKWEFDFFTRLFETDRLLELDQESLAKKSSFWENRNKFN